MAFRFRSLRSKFIFWITIFLVSIFAAQALISIKDETARLKKELIDGAITFSKLSARPLVEAYERYYATGFHKFREMVEDILKLNENIVRIQLIDIQGKILFDTQDLKRKRMEELERVSLDILEKVRKPNPYHVYIKKDLLKEIIHPYLEEWGKHSYSLRYFVSHKTIAEKTTRSIIQNVLRGILLIGVAVFIENLLSIRVIIDPLHRLEEGARIIGSGNLDYRIHLKTKDEIEELGKQFNEMALKLKESYSGLEEKIKQATRHIKEEKIKLEALLKSLGEGVCALDEERKIVLFNPQLEEITGYKRGEFLDHSFSDFLEKILAPHQEEIKKSKEDLFFEILTNQFTSKSFFVPQFYILTKDKKSKVLALISTPVLIRNRTKGRINVFRDITKEKEIEKLKSQFVSITSHQLRTPLTSIKWYLEMLISGEMGRLSKKQEEFVKQVYESNEKMINLVNDLLIVSRIEEGRLPLEPTWFSLEDVVRQEIKKIGLLAQAHHCQISFSAPVLPKVWADPLKIAQVVENFLSNSIKYSHPERKGKIKVSLSKKDNYILCSVKDNGLGIPEREQHRVFTRFFRAENIQPLQIQGTGLGLYICKGIIEASGGKIWFKSKENKGTIFYFTLPCFK